MKPGIRLKLFLVCVGLIGVSVMAAEIYLTDVLEEQLTARIHDDLLVRAGLIAQRVASSPIRFEDEGPTDALADEAGRAAHARVTLVRNDGTVAGDSVVERRDLAGLENHAQRPEIVEALARGEGTSVRYSTTTNQRMMYVAVPISRQGAAVGTARLAMGLTEIDHAKWELRKALGIAALLALAVAVLASSAAAHLTSRKLRDLTSAARSMAAGNLSTRTRIAGHDEIAALGDALNQLAQSLTLSLDELRGERDLLTGILTSMHEGVLVVGSDGRVVLTNPALKKMLLIDADAVGKSVLQVIRNAELNALFERAARSGAADAELDLSAAARRRVLVRAVSLQGAPGAVLAVFVDVTELRRLEAVRRDFVANASHELRSPLTTVRAAAETLQSIRNDPQATQKFLDLIERNAERLENLINDLLDLSRIESREHTLELEPVDLDLFVEKMVSQYGPRAALKRITLTRDLSAVPGVRADRRALEQVFGNLIDNALKYCPDGAVVRISGAGEDQLVRIAVSDTGPGIPPAHVPRVFERFYRVDAGRSRELGGTGLGLSIVKHLVEAMGGSAGVDSRPGAGSTFWFTLHRA